MKIIVGLGNPGEKYSQNRHNVGFMFADYLIDHLHTKHNLEIKSESRFDSVFSRIVLQHETYVVSKPQTFMNRSGDAVSAVMQLYKIHLEDVYVVHDDLDIPLGKFKIQKGTGPKLHNGITSIEEKLGTKDFWRIRIGVENRGGEHRLSGEAYVLQDFAPEESRTIQAVFHDITSRLTH